MEDLEFTLRATAGRCTHDCHLWRPIGTIFLGEMVIEEEIAEAREFGNLSELEGNTEPPSSWSPWWLVAGATAVSLLEIGAYLVGGWVGWFAARVWVAGSVVFGLACVVVVVRVLVRDLRTLRLASLALIAVTAFVAFWHIGSADHLKVNHEATQEIGAGMDALALPDLGYTGTGFIGYPVRQYLLAAGPTVLLGRSLTALRLGFALPFFWGVLVCWAGLRVALGRIPQASSLATLTVLAFFTFPFLPEFARMYEQNTIPFSLTALATGWFLLAEEEPRPLRLMALAWVGCMLGTSYTPSLATLGLLAVVIIGKAVTALRDRHVGTAIAWATVLVPPLVFTAMTVTNREDLRFDHVGGANLDGVFSALQKAFALVFLGEPRFFVSPLLLLPIAVYLLVALFFGAGLRHAVTAWWVVATVAIAVTVRGYATPPPAYAIHRALIIIPPLMVGMLAWLLSVGGMGRLWIPGRVLTAIGAIFLAATVFNVRAAEQRSPPGLRDRLVSDLASQTEHLGMREESRPTVVVLTARAEADNLPDYLMYFLPGARFLRNASDLTGEQPGPIIIYADLGRWPDALNRAGVLPQREMGFDHPVFGHRFQTATVEDRLQLEP